MAHWTREMIEADTEKDFQSYCASGRWKNRGRGHSIPMSFASSKFLPRLDILIEQHESEMRLRNDLSNATDWWG